MATINKWLGMISEVTGGHQTYYSGEKYSLWSHISSCKGVVFDKRRWVLAQRYYTHYLCPGFLPVAV